MAVTRTMNRRVILLTILLFELLNRMHLGVRSRRASGDRECPRQPAGQTLGDRHQAFTGDVVEGIPQGEQFGCIVIHVTARVTASAPEISFVPRITGWRRIL